MTKINDFDIQIQSDEKIPFEEDFEWMNTFSEEVCVDTDDADCKPD